MWKKLKSGSDIRGIAVADTAYGEITLTDEVISQIASAFVLFISEKTNKAPSELKIAVGHDSRISAERIKAAVISSLCEAGVTVADCSLATTPAMFMTTVDLGCDASVEITASHHPYYRNGLKFFTTDGGLTGEDIEAVLTYCENGKKAVSDIKGNVETVDYMSQYAAKLREMIKTEVRADDYEHPLAGFKLVVDAGNGVGGFYAEKVLAPLGADVSGSQFLDPDGYFPNHIPNPEDKAAMDSICARTKAENADLGIIFDTDVDRAGAVDCQGKEINRNRLVALAAAIALEGNDGGTIVTDSITSDGLRVFIEETLGGSHYRYRRGYNNVIGKAKELNSQGVNCPLAIETSGHAALRDNYFLDDGAYLITRIIIKMAQLRQKGSSVDELISALKEPVETKEIRIKIVEDDFRACGEAIINELEGFAVQSGFTIAPDNREGIRISFNEDKVCGWCLLRLSVHDPILPFNIESDTEGGVEIILSYLKEFFTRCKGIELSFLSE